MQDGSTIPQAGPIATQPWNVVGQTSTSPEVVGLHQHTWLEERRQKLKRLNGSTPVLSAAASPAPAGINTSSTTPHLLQTVHVDDDVAIQVAIGATGVDVNDTAQVKKALDKKITTAGDVLKLVNAYHKAVIRPELVHLTVQIEQCLVRLDDQVSYVTANLNWLASDQRKEQRQRASVMLLLNGFPKDWAPARRLYIIRWMMSQVPALCQWVTRMGFNHTAQTEGDQIFNVLATEPITLQHGKSWSRMTMLVFKGFDLRKAMAEVYVGQPNTPLYEDAKTAVGGSHVQVLYSTPQYQRKLEAPLRVLMKALNDTADYVDCNMVPLWKSLTLMWPCYSKDFQEEARACAHIEYSEESGQLICTVHIAEEIHPKLLEEHSTTLHEDGTKCDLWEAAWYAQLYGGTLDEDLLESQAKDSMAAGKAPPGVTKPKGKGKGKHWAQALVHADQNNPYPITLKWKAHTEVPFNWNEHCMKFKREDLKVEEAKAVTLKGKPA